MIFDLHLRRLSLVVAIVLLETNCGRRPNVQSTKPSDRDLRIQPNVVVEESSQWGDLGLKIVKAYEHQECLNQPPWHAGSGDWTFLDCALAKDPSVKMVIGIRATKSRTSEIPVSWGEAFLATEDGAAGARFVAEFAKAFHTQAPPSHGNKPPGFVRMTTANLGSDLVRHPAGGFKAGKGGTWAATKWFLQKDGGEAEVFFNYSVAEQRAEFSEKDEEYREDLIQQLVAGLRDGPSPERTTGNDPNLTLSGPRARNWTRIAGPSETCQFGPKSDFIAIVVSESGKPSKLMIAPTQNPSNREVLAEFEGSATVLDFLPRDEGLAVVLVEFLRKDSKVISSTDPQRLWLVDGQGKHAINAPPGVEDVFPLKDSIAPDAKFVAFYAWQTEANNRRRRIIHLGNLATGEWRKIEKPGGVLEIVAWHTSDLTALVLDGIAFEKMIRKPYSLNLSTARLSPLDSSPAESISGHELSPDRRHSVDVIEKDRLVITDLLKKEKREFIFHPDDRRHVYPESIKWVDDRYIVFQGPRTALINTETLKMNFAVEKESPVNSVEFSLNFKFALGYGDDGCYLAAMEFQP